MNSNLLVAAQEKLEEKGFLELPVEADLDLKSEILALKQQKNAIILAHYYQTGDIQDIADYLGDSLGLARKAATTQADIILFAGVHFMAETAKILNPTKKVLLPDLKAGCSLADAAPTAAFKAFKAAHPDHIVISYINCTAEIKALSDIICTSSNAVQIVNSVPKEQPILFAPDKNLGRYVIEQTGRDMLLWDGACMVHEVFSVKKLVKLKTKHPDALVLAHPECEAPVLAHADFIGSTTALLQYAHKSDAKSFIVVTESGILHQMQKSNPEKTFIPAPPNANCACNDCPYMKLNTLQKIYLALKFEQPELLMDEKLRLQAQIPLERMLAISN